MKDRCYGCDGNTNATKKDHMHQYINIRGEAVMGWFISDRFYTDLNEAIGEVAKLYEVPRVEAHTYINKIPKKYN